VSTLTWHVPQTNTRAQSTNGHFPIKRDPAGHALLNLACGTKTDPCWNNLDFSPYATLKKHPTVAALLHSIGLLSQQRAERLASLDPEIIRWNLARGVPFAADSFDMVYHSHFLEHLDRDAGCQFLAECRRVLKPGGVLRVVVPDLELLIRGYCASMAKISTHEFGAEAAHEDAIFQLFDQMVRNEASGTKEQVGWRKRIEQLLRGNAAKTGETHRWMYDRHSLRRTLEALGFADVSSQSAATGQFPGWKDCRLDLNPDGSAYKPESLYVEARKPRR
jgi:ubiquinone/menaquinone biosynthesis C-methylase UbiE